MQAAITLIPLLPLAAFTVNIFFGRRLKGTSAYLAIGAILSSFAISVAVFLRILSDPAPIAAPLFDWITVADLSVTMGFMVDRLTAIMLLVVTGVGSLIHIYSVGYMHGDPRFSRFFAYLNLFAAMMLVLVLGDNFLAMFLGWEGVGLCSYLLIGFWFEKPFDEGTTNDAARKAFVVNRIGDFGFLLGVMLIWTTFGGIGYAEVQGSITNSAAAGVLPVAIMTAIGLLLFLGATGKSAQIPLHVWLPDAMAGPTPVSALIHAATMVTAGVYMVARCHFIFDVAPIAQNVVLWVGALTALFAATMAVAQNDIKKVLAYSTISQLGYMFMGVGAAAYAAGIMHLMTHAFFKALLFLGAGAVIHALNDEQDISRMGGLRKKLPTVYWPFVLGSLALAGFPLTAGFFSKDSILAGVFSGGHFVPWALGVATAGLTAFYTFRLVFLTFFGGYRGTVDHPHVPAKSMATPLAILAVLSLIGGYFEVPFHLVGAFSGFLAPVVGPNPLHLTVGAEVGLMAVTLTLIAVGIFGAWKLYAARTVTEVEIAEEPTGIMRVLRDRWYVDELYDLTIIRPLKWVSSAVLWRVVDNGIIHGFVVQFCGGYLWKGVGFVTSFWHTGRVGSYAYGMIGGVLLLLYMILG